MMHVAMARMPVADAHAPRTAVIAAVPTAVAAVPTAVAAEAEVYADTPALASGVLMVVAPTVMASAAAEVRRIFLNMRFLLGSKSSSFDVPWCFVFRRDISAVIR